jgi:hypothetical protein
VRSHCPKASDCNTSPALTKPSGKTTRCALFTLSSWLVEPLSTTQLHTSGPISSPTTLRRRGRERGNHEFQGMKTSFGQLQKHLHFNAMTHGCGGV